MKNRLTLSFFTILAITLVSACSGKDNSTDIALSEVPANVINRIQNVLPGISLNAAKKQLEGDTTIYELEGKLINGKKYEIEMTESGEIIEIELED